MEEFQTLMPDRETFLRVWKRVMPDDSVSPIAIAPPPPPEVRRAENPVRGNKAPGWEQLLSVMDEGLAGGMELARRWPGTGPVLDSLRSSARQIRGAYFLQSGRHWPGSGRTERVREPIPTLLRQQYIWEIRWSDLCRQAEEGMERKDEREVLGELEEQSAKRRRMLRNLLAQR